MIRKEILLRIMMDYFVFRDVQRVRQIFWNDFSRACGGIPPAIDYTPPEFLTPEKVLYVRARLQLQEAELIARFLAPLDNEGLSFWEDEEKVLRLMTLGGFHLETNDER